MTDDDSNTIPKQLQGKTFKDHPERINRKGRPKSFDKLRDLAQSLANEAATGAGGVPIEINGHVASQIEMLLRTMIMQNPERFVEIAFGKVPDQSENYNIDLDNLSDEQLEKLASGSSLRTVVATASRRKIKTPTARTAAADNANADTESANVDTQ